MVEDSRMKKILIVEDEAHLAQGLKFNLELEGMQADLCETAESAWPIFRQYDLMILDVMLPEMSGLDLLRLIRAEHPQYPVLILSAKSTEDDLVQGLAAGADDYMTKPFSLAELMLRIRGMLRRQSWYAEGVQAQGSYHFGPYWINFATLEAETAQGQVLLTPYECYVMKYLIENKQRSVSRAELLEKVWGHDRSMETRTVDAFMVRLRKLFETDRKNPHFIISIRGIGYRFIDEAGEVPGPI
jgi:DNA-binding response OmpR family regulator